MCSPPLDILERCHVEMESWSVCELELTRKLRFDESSVDVEMGRGYVILIDYRAVPRFSDRTCVFFHVSYIKA